MNLTALSQRPAGFDDCDRLLQQIDLSLATGFSRLSEDLREALQALAQVFGGTPLADSVADSVERLLRSEFSTKAFVALAAARASLFGAMHDALSEQAATVFGFQMPASADDTPAIPGQMALLAATQQWLGELAVSGFANIESCQLNPFAQTLEQIQAQSVSNTDQADLVGFAALLTGYFEELLQISQSKSRDDLQARRLADLWCAAMLGAQQPARRKSFRRSSGLFHPCGLDVRSHSAFMKAYVYGLLQNGEDVHMARLAFSSWKVSIVSGDEHGRLLGEHGPVILEALAKGDALALQEAELFDNGDLRLTGAPEAATKATPFDLPSPWGAFPLIDAARRHPVQLIQMVKLEGVSFENGSVKTANGALPLALGRMDRVDLDDKALGLASEVIGLLRYDNGFCLQPLMLRGKGKLKDGIRAGQGVSARLAKTKNDSLAVLQERASRLLRK